ncbi:nucleotidyltransferase family protein [Cohnella phaseoli]|uniref:CBS domain protein n=1 Tax=Cohnella phaseoli TaxID=456490 RepID=A0A3D9KD51_9BACL|nr:nucleotidyltransferase family protein [Cohnella phaseoli]RED84035.1 CBS domain protein [Cohnella phaseoli]
MDDWKKTLLSNNCSIRDAIECLESNSLGIVLVVNGYQVLEGTITDGDIRRGILKGISLTEPVGTIMNHKPTVAFEHEGKASLRAIMTNKHIRQIPVVDRLGRIVRLETSEDLHKPQQLDNWVVLMAGGLGSRLRPLTNECPKPLLKVGGKPLLETTLERFISQGFRNFYLTVNYKAEMIVRHFGDGSQWGVNIRYVRENKRMGTAGALSLLPHRPDKPFIIMNGDLLTSVNFNNLIAFHKEHKSYATMCVRDYEYQIPYGVVNINKQKFVSIEEKPIHQYFVNAGVYVLDPIALDYIPSDQFYDMPDLFTQIRNHEKELTVFPIREYWLDIGRIEDFEKANIDFMEVFG